MIYNIFYALNCAAEFFFVSIGSSGIGVRQEFVHPFDCVFLRLALYNFAQFFLSTFGQSLRCRRSGNATHNAVCAGGEDQQPLHNQPPKLKYPNTPRKCGEFRAPSGQQGGCRQLLANASIAASRVSA
jgi:hypothetical protein